MQKLLLRRGLIDKEVRARPGLARALIFKQAVTHAAAKLQAALLEKG